MADSFYTVLMDKAILHHGTPNMVAYQVERGTGNGFVKGYRWQLAMMNGRLLYSWPWGAPILSLPGVAALEAFGYDVAPGNVYSGANEVQMQTILTTVLSAAVVWLLYETAVAVLPVSWATMLALSAAFGTQMWSSVSRSLWAQTWYLFLVNVVILMLLRRWYRPALLGTLLVWIWFVRPMAAPMLLVLGAYILFELQSSRARVIYVTAGAIWAGALVTLMLFFTGYLLAPAYSGAATLLTRHGFVSRLEGILFSPSRGLLIFFPIFVIPLYLTARYWTELPSKRLAALALVAIATITATLAYCDIWWGGFSYGPRDMADAIPWFFLLAVLGFKAFLDDCGAMKPERVVLVTMATLLLAVSVMMNVPGVFSAATSNWNAVPNNIDDHSERLWDWQHPQFLAWAHGG